MTWAKSMMGAAVADSVALLDAALFMGVVGVGDTAGDARAAEGAGSAMDRLLIGAGCVLGDAAGTRMAADCAALHALNTSAMTKPESIHLGTMNQPFARLFTIK
jgi:hypothetical protein